MSEHIVDRIGGKEHDPGESGPGPRNAGMASVNAPARHVPVYMKAAVLTDDRPSLLVTRIPVPIPRADEALVRITAGGVCHTDLHVIKNEVAFPCPAVLGHEISGTVVAFGEGTTDGRGLKVGDQVVGAFIMPCSRCEARRRGRDDLCEAFFHPEPTQRHALRRRESAVHARRLVPGNVLDGGLAEYSVVPLSALALLPEGLEPKSAAILGCAVFTAYGAVHRAGGVQPGQSVAVVAVGGVGSSLVQVARAAGAETVIAVNVASDKLENAKRLGATHLINSREMDAVAAVREITGGRGVDVAFEALGHPATFRQAVGMLADGGWMVAIGIASGAANAEVDIAPLVHAAARPSLVLTVPAPASTCPKSYAPPPRGRSTSHAW